MLFLLAVFATHAASSAYRATNFVLSILFLLANASRVIITAMRVSDVLGYAQVLLLVGVLFANARLSIVSSRWSPPARLAAVVAA